VQSYWRSEVVSRKAAQMAHAGAEGELDGPGQQDRSGEGGGPVGQIEPDAHGGQHDPAGLLSEVSRLRREARSNRHAYWFPLVIFGLLTCASVPFYVLPAPRQGIVVLRGPRLFAFGGPGPGWQGYLAYYWLAAILAGLALTWQWYRRRGRRAGLVTSARGYVIAGAVLVLLTLGLSLMPAGMPLLPGDLIIRGTFPFVIIALGLWVLARAERSWGLLAIAAVYTAAALVASLYDIENVLFRLGWNPYQTGGFAERLTTLPNVLLPALILLVAGGGAFLAQRRRRWQTAP
jgi:hypothetical protein